MHPLTGPPPPPGTLGFLSSSPSLAPPEHRRLVRLTMTEQNGIDILCDAAGSDLLLSSIFPSDAQNQTQNQHPPPQKKVKRSDASPPVAASVTSVISAPFASSSNHICHICKRVYERADHLTRHLRSHENARPYQCTRCPKRFNRAYDCPPRPSHSIPSHRCASLHCLLASLFSTPTIHNAKPGA